jgi:processive 1,2-diacylglycerol beta-glucosyltransferase
VADTPQYCPVCGETYKWYEAECPVDHVRLVERPGPPPDPNAALVSVFRTNEPGLLPLARLALEQEQIEHDIRDPGLTHQLVGYRQASGSSAIDTPLEILVRAEDAERARALLIGLGNSMAAAAEAPAVGGPALAARPGDGGERAATVRLVDDESNRPVGWITEAQLGWLNAHLEQESADDRDYYVDRATIEMIADLGADASLVEILRRALGDRDNITVRWSKDQATGTGH